MTDKMPLNIRKPPLSAYRRLQYRFRLELVGLITKANTNRALAAAVCYYRFTIAFSFRDIRTADTAQ